MNFTDIQLLIGDYLIANNCKVTYQRRNSLFAVTNKDAAVSIEISEGWLLLIRSSYANNTRCAECKDKIDNESWSDNLDYCNIDLAHPHALQQLHTYLFGEDEC